MPQIAELFHSMTYGTAPESDAAAVAWLDAHNRHFDLFINNQWTPPAEGNTLSVSNPARGETLAQVADKVDGFGAAVGVRDGAVCVLDVDLHGGRAVVLLGHGGLLLGRDVVGLRVAYEGQPQRLAA